MNVTNYAASTLQWLSMNVPEFIISFVVIAVYMIIDRFSSPRIEAGADQGQFEGATASRAIRIARLFTAFVGLLILALVWGVRFESVFIFATTTLTLLGVALFASWSLLSNVTAYFILLLHPSFNRGTFLRVIDVDNYAEGYISDLTLFHTKLVTKNKEIIVYPNNLLLGRITVINPSNKFGGVGKLPPNTKNDDPASEP